MILQRVLDFTLHASDGTRARPSSLYTYSMRSLARYRRRHQYLGVPPCGVHRIWPCDL